MTVGSGRPGIRKSPKTGGWVVLATVVAGAWFLGWATTQYWVTWAHADTLSYAYDASGRVIQATNNSAGQAIFYSYDAAGNITSQTIVPLGTLAISGLSADQGITGSQLTIDGTGFSTIPSNNVVTLNGAAVTVVSATATQLVVTVPAGATSGIVSVRIGGTTVNSPTSFSVTTGTSAPTITGFSPSSGVAGTAVTISGSNFQSAVSSNKVLVNGRAALVTAVTPTALTITIPPDVASGPIQVLTPYGRATSSSNLIVPPPGYSPSSIASIVQTTEGGRSVSVTIGTNQVALVLFNGNAGDVNLRAAVQTTASLIEVLDPSGKAIASGCTSACLYNLPKLVVAGTYTVVVGSPQTGGTFPVTVATSAPGGINLSWANEGNLANAWADAVNVNTAQRSILTFSGAAGQLTEVDFRNLFNTWTASLWNASGQTLWSSTLTSGTSSVSIPALPANGTYSVIFDPQFTSGSFQYEAGIVASSMLTVNGATVTVNGGGPSNIDGGPIAKVLFSGTAGQTLSLKVTATQGFFYGVDTYYQSSSGQTCLSGCGSGPSGGTCTIALPALPITGTYVVYVKFGVANYSTATLSLSSGTAGSICTGNTG